MSVSLEQPMRPYLKALGESLDNTDASVAQLAQDLQTLDGELDSTNAEIATIAQNVQALDSELADTNTEVGAIAQNVQGLQRQLHEIPFEYVRTYDTVAEMQSDDNLLSGMVCHTNGFHAAGDGGAAYYIIGTTGTANGMDVLACANSLIATLVVTEPYITPEQFGAYGDGTHDDTVAMQACIKSGNTANLEHTYLITQALSFFGVTDFTMQGGTITRPSNQTFNSVYGSDCRRITIKNVVFEGNGNDRNMTYTWKDNVQACIILAPHSKEIRVEKCRISDFNYGVFICGSDIENQPISYDNTALNGVIRDCTFHNCNSPIDTYGKGVVIDHNVLYDTTGNAIQLEPNYSASDADNPEDDSYYYTAAVGCVVTSNLLVGVDGIAINVGNSNSYGVSILRNTIIDYKQGFTGIGKSIIIDGNQFLYQRPQTPDANTRPWGWTPTILVNNRTTVTNNYFWKPDVAVRIVGGSTISGNTIESPRFTAIAVYMLSATIDNVVNVAENKIIGHVINASLWWASRAIVSGNSKNLFLENNVVDSDAQPLYVISGSTAKVSGLISNVAETDTITAPSGFSVYSN